MSCAKDWFEAMHGRPRTDKDLRINFTPALRDQAAALGLRKENGGALGAYIEIREKYGHCPEKTYCLPLYGETNMRTGGQWSKTSRRPMPRIACVPAIYVADKLESKKEQNRRAGQKRKARKIEATQRAIEDEQEKRRKFEADQTPEELAALEAAEGVRLQALMSEFTTIIEVQEEVAAEYNIEPFPLPPDFGYNVFPEEPASTQPDHPNDGDWEHDEYIAGLMSNVWDDPALLAQAANYGALEWTDPPLFPPPGCGGKPP